MLNETRIIVTVSHTTDAGMYEVSRMVDPALWKRGMDRTVAQRVVSVVIDNALKEVGYGT